MDRPTRQDQDLHERHALPSPAPSLRVLVAEDDVQQLQGLVAMISRLRPSWEVVAQCADTASTLNAIDELAPDLAILDIHLAGSAGPDWLERLPAELAVIFVTGDAELAVRAFERAAVDYLLKPVVMRRLKMALDRAATDRRVGAAAAPADSRGEGSLQFLNVSRGHELLVIRPDEICFLQADHKYTRVVMKATEGIVRMSLTELHDRLDSATFVRIHRSVVVNIAFVAMVRRNPMGATEVVLRDRGDVLKVSKGFTGVFKAT
jgi:DNA-binding LytR/AlgR family response regulator